MGAGASGDPGSGGCATWAGVDAELIGAGTAASPPTKCYIGGPLGSCVGGTLLFKGTGAR